MNNNSFDPNSSNSDINNQPQTTEQDPFDLQSLNNSIAPNENPSDSNSPDDLHTQVPNKLDALEPTHEFNFDSNSGRDFNNSGFQQQFSNQNNQGQEQGQPPPLNQHHNNQNNHWQNQQPHSNTNNQQAQNPYAAPSIQSMEHSQFAEGDEGHFGLLEEPRKNGAGRGMVWLTEAFNIFKENLLMWTASGFVLLIVFFIMGFVPFASLLMFHLTAGVMVACANQEEGEGIEIGSLFEPFKTHFVPILLMSLIYTGIVTVMIVLLVIIFIIGGALGGDGTAGVLLSLLGVLVAMALFIPMLMAVYHAPALIVLHDIEPLESIKMSFRGCMKNMVPFLVFGLVTMFIFPLLIIFTIGLGFFVVYPIALITYYTSYRDIWSERMIGD